MARVDGIEALMGFGEFVTKKMEGAGTNANALAKKVGTDRAKLIYWFETAQTPNQIIRLLKLLRQESGQSLSAFYGELEKEVEG